MPWRLALTGRRHRRFSEIGVHRAPLETCSHRASPWPIFGIWCSQGVAMTNFVILAVTLIYIKYYHAFGNWRSQGVAMANFRKQAFTGRRHGQFSDIGLDLNISLYIYISISYSILPCLCKQALTGRRHGQFSAQ